MAVRIAPVVRQQFFDNQGRVAAGMKVFTYAATTTTKLATFTSSTGGVQNANPIVLDSAGRTPSGFWLTDGSLYKIVLAPANDTDPPTSATWSEDNVGSGDATLSALSSSSSSLGDKLVATKRTATGAIATTVHDWIEGQIYNLKTDFGAVGDGVANDTAAIQAALNVSTGGIGAGVLIYCPPGTYLYDSLTFPDYAALCGAGQRSTQFKKKSNAALITLAERSVIDDIGFDGNSKTGVLINIPTGKNYQRLRNVESRNCVDNVVTFAADGGGEFLAIGCALATTLTPGAGAAVKISSGADSGAVPRRFIGCTGAGSTLIDISGMNGLTITDCRTEGILAGSASAEIFMHGNRIGSNAGAIATTTFTGVSSGMIDGNTFATAVVLNNCSAVHFDNEVPSNGVTETGTKANDIVIARTVYTPSWTSTGTQPVLNNGTLTGLWWRQGRVIRGQIKLSPGSTTTFGTGTYSISVPFTNTSGVDYVGVVRLLNVATAFLVGTVIVASGASTMQFYINNSTAAMTPTTPVTFANGDSIHAQFEFNIF